MEPGVIKIISKRDYFWLALYEVLGTTLFLLGINYSENDASYVAFALFLAIILCGKVGGGHFNGAVTLGVYMTE